MHVCYHAMIPCRKAKVPGCSPSLKALTPPGRRRKTRRLIRTVPQLSTLWAFFRCPDLFLDCTPLKLAHNVTRNRAYPRYLQIVRPNLAVASLGRGNEFGHPHPETLALLERRAVPLLRTDQDGTIQVVSDRSLWWLPRHAGIVRESPNGDEEGAFAGGRRSI
jgi:hypothetical protein